MMDDVMGDDEEMDDENTAGYNFTKDFDLRDLIEMLQELMVDGNEEQQMGLTNPQ